MSRTLLIASFVLALVFAAAAQNLGYSQDPTWRAPQQYQTRSNPLRENSNFAGGGKKLFLRHCAECHGEDGRGLKKAADLQLPFVQSQSDGTLFWKITNGNQRHNMPSFSGLPEAQRWQIVLYLRTLPKSEAQLQEPGK